jgi:CubicO group peptidase (beta-lactamase class C family)
MVSPVTADQHHRKDSTMPGTRISGVEDGWGKVADVFRANFEGDPGEVGAACSVYVDGRPVVDLWDGLADRKTNRPWTGDTVAQVASTTKGATAICAHLLAQRTARTGSPCAGCCRTRPDCRSSTDR